MNYLGDLARNNKVKGRTSPYCRRLSRVVVWVDQGYSGENFARVVKQVCGEQVQVEVIERTAKTFERLPKR